MSQTQIFCGASKKVPKGKRIGSMKECFNMNQVRFWGLQKIDPQLFKMRDEQLKIDQKIKSMKKSKDKLLATLAGLNGRIRKYNGEIAIKGKTKKEKADIQKKIDSTQNDIMKTNERIKTVNTEISKAEEVKLKRTRETSKVNIQDLQEKKYNIVLKLAGLTGRLRKYTSSIRSNKTPEELKIIQGNIDDTTQEINDLTAKMQEINDKMNVGNNSINNSSSMFSLKKVGQVKSKPKSSTQKPKKDKSERKKKTEDEPILLRGQVKCECGRVVSQKGLSKHLKTKIHNDLMNNL